MNQLVEINLVFQWFDHCLNTFTYQIVKINQISREKIISTRSHGKILGKHVQCFIKTLVKKSNFNVSEQLILILKHFGLLKQRMF